MDYELDQQIEVINFWIIENYLNYNQRKDDQDIF
jgi:hypothetical protein